MLLTASIFSAALVTWAITYRVMQDRYAREIEDLRSYCDYGDEWPERYRWEATTPRNGHHFEGHA